MPKRDRTGIFIKTEVEGYTFVFTFPPLKKIFCWILLFVILLPWLCIAFKYDVLSLIMEKEEDFLMKSDKEALKKMDYLAKLKKQLNKLLK